MCPKLISSSGAIPMLCKLLSSMGYICLVHHTLSAGVDVIELHPTISTVDSMSMAEVPKEGAP